MWPYHQLPITPGVLYQLDIIIYKCIRDVLFMFRTVSVVRDRDSRDILLERETIELCKQPSRHGTEVKAQST